MKVKRKVKVVVALALSAIVAIGGVASATVPDARYCNVVEARKSQAGTQVSIRGAIVEELQNGKFLVRDASGYIVMNVDRSAPYYSEIEKDTTVLYALSSGEEPSKAHVRTIADPNAIVEIVGTIVNGSRINEINAESIELRGVENVYSDAYNRIEGFNSRG